MNILLLYRRHFLWWEFAFSLILITGLISYFKLSSLEYIIYDMLNGARAPFYSAVAAVAGTLLGFSLTGVSILLTLTGVEEAALLRRSEHYPKIYSVYTSSIAFLAISTLAGIAGIVFDKDAFPNLGVFYFVLWSFIISSLRVWRCLWVLENIIAIVTKPKN